MGYINFSSEIEQSILLDNPLPIEQWQDFPESGGENG
jgi:hypothetical protein